jgi:hypothetical protein
MEHKYLRELLNYIEEPNRDKCLSLFSDNKDRFEASPGSLTKHQAWTGGYIHHLEETMNFGIGLYKMMNDYRELDFTLSDVILVLFLHDLEKPFRYVEPKQEFSSDQDKESFIQNVITQYRIVLAPEHLNALKYIHGEGDDYSRTERVQGPLAAFVHICDVASARIWFDFPKTNS